MNRPVSPIGQKPAEPEPVKMVKMTLMRNYCPAGEVFEIVGHVRPEISRKDAAGRMQIIQAEEFIEGIAAPPKLAGTGFATKLWAGTVVKLPEDEARVCRKAGIASVEFAD